ncbi:MAG: FAD:protein FMN transferase [Pedobacter sp.]|nr:FAD:protein FMN transferase [Pedobacter sp.]MDQ8053609.1 FAD:protein FMN transferase [Pedobacter sp.]
MLKAIPYFSILLMLPCLWIGKDRPLREFKIHGLAQGTTYSISYFAEDSIVTKTHVDVLLAKIDSSMSLYKDYSTINKFNRSEKGWPLGAQFTKVVKRAFDIYKDSGGLFDITVGPLVQYWGFGAQPAQGDLEAIMPNIGMDLLAWDGNFLRKKKGAVQIDVNGIAQGYSVDVVADELLKHGIQIFLVEIGGELRANGVKPDGKSWRVGIEGPSEHAFEEPVIQHVISVNSGAITTSGNYRKYLMKGGQKLSHLIDPKTGHPLTNEMVSVTVYAPDAITADGYDNVLMAMHVQEALDFVEKRKGLAAYIIYKTPEGKLVDTLSTGFKKLMVN